MSAVSFESRDLPKERQCFGEASLARGAGTLNTLKIILSWLESRQSGTRVRSVCPARGRRLEGGTGILGVGGRGVRGFFAPAALSACRTRGGLGQPAPSSGEAAGFLAAAVFVFWVLRDCVGSQQ